MKRIALTLFSTLVLGCSNPHTFVLNDTKENKPFELEQIHRAYQEGQIEGSPIIVINGIPFRYNKKQDTIVLPLKKSDIIQIAFLNKNSSRIIYNEKENDGAILINAKTQSK